MLAQEYRDSRFETFRVVFTQRETWWGECGYTSRLPVLPDGVNASVLYPWVTPEADNELNYSTDVELLRATLAKRLGRNPAQRETLG